jgi:hypothetical protein
MKGSDIMAEKKVIVCCGASAENLGEGLSCKVEETDKGFTISVTSDNPDKLKQLKEKMKSCCDSDDAKSRC